MTHRLFWARLFAFASAGRQVGAFLFSGKPVLMRGTAPILNNKPAFVNFLGSNMLHVVRLLFARFLPGAKSCT
jgi:hypothetical protein